MQDQGTDAGEAAAGSARAGSHSNRANASGSAALSAISDKIRHHVRPRSRRPNPATPVKFHKRIEWARRGSMCCIHAWRLHAIPLLGGARSASHSSSSINRSRRSTLLELSTSAAAVDCQRQERAAVERLEEIIVDGADLGTELVRAPPRPWASPRAERRGDPWGLGSWRRAQAARAVRSRWQ